MGYLNFEQQMTNHLQFLREKGLEVNALVINSSEFIRSRYNQRIGAR